MNFIKRLITWWDSQTLGTQLYTWQKGRRVGEDFEGNVYYENGDGSRRWVIYNGNMEASRVSSHWHGWLHYTFDEPPTVRPFPKHEWERPHSENLTGTPQAYVPSGSLRTGRAKAPLDYTPWEPQ